MKILYNISAIQNNCRRNVNMCTNALPKPDIKQGDDQQGNHDECYRRGFEFEHGFIQDKCFWIYFGAQETDADHEKHREKERKSHTDMKGNLIMAVAVEVGGVEKRVVAEPCGCVDIEEY